MSPRPRDNPSRVYFPLLHAPVASRSPRHEKLLVSTGLCRAGSRFWLPTITPALFSDIGLDVEMSLVPKVLGRQTPAFKHHCRACLEAQGMKAPEGFRHFGRWVGRWEPKVLISDPITSCPRCRGWWSSTLFNGNTIIWGFFVFFFNSPGYSEKQRQSGLWAVSGLPISHDGCAVPSSLSVDISGAIVVVYLCCIAVPQPKMGDSVLVLTSLVSHSDLMVTLMPWDWINLAVVVGFPAPECCWAMEKLADVRAETGFSAKDRSWRVLQHIW